MVLDRETGDLASGAVQILKGCAEENSVRNFVSAELMQSMIEVKTGRLPQCARRCRPTSSPS